MFNTKSLARNIVLAGAFPLLLASSVFAQNRDDSQTNPQGDRAYANRSVEGTVASVERARDGQRVRLTNGMDLFVPNSVTGVNEGRRYQASMLRPGDVVRMGVYSRDRDGRDVQVRSIELLQSNSIGDNERRLNGTVVSFDRRNNLLVVRTENNRMVNVNLRNNRDRFRRGDRVSISGRMDRGSFIADGIHVDRRN